ncbi:MAG: TSUP family transporter [Paracoccaceae bacterium]
MADLLSLALAGLDPAALIALLLTSFAGSFITVSLGIGGGALLLAMMASLMPAAALIPVHGVVQLGSNLFRAGLMRRHIQWAPLVWFAAGSLLGVGLGGMIAVALSPAWIQIGVGGFVIWNVLMQAPKWLSKNAWLIGGITSFLTMFFGASGVFVANFTKSLQLERQAHVATHASLMSLQHMLKIFAFGLLGFAFGPWIFFIALMIGAGFLGTLAGRAILLRINDKAFKRALDIVLVLISLRLIWNGVAGLI